MSIENHDELATTPARETALSCVAAGIEAALPERVVADHVRVVDGTLVVSPAAGGDATDDLDSFSTVRLVGAGKGAGRLAAALVDVLDGRVDGGVVVADEPADAGPVDVCVGDHPVPTDRNVDAARRIRDCVADAPADALVLVALTGGASALLTLPAGALTVDDLAGATRDLLDSGASIDELNAVRKHCSAVKGGRLAGAGAPTRLVTLAVSDVVGDDPSVVGSGPTAPDSTTYTDALAVLDRYEVDAPAVREHLQRGVDGTEPETPRADDPAFDRADYHVLANAETALSAAATEARERGYEPLVLSSCIEGEACEAGRFHAAVAREASATGRPVRPPAVLLSGGECTVSVGGDGIGGPNLEFGLAAALALRGTDDVAVAAVDTDGRDGSTDAAGALVDGATVTDEGAARAALADNDSLGYLEERNAVPRTGATGTNVNDLRVVVVDRER
ncbi:glycerate kinase type-2 family protein [Haloarchaeobius baliensis]|uniref:glycerate kinase type-2 family protein n=1 Tax=Haloarchaeobius baliensis TaxID=1670458 RepID=UPI003F8803F6